MKKSIVCIITLAVLCVCAGAETLDQAVQNGAAYLASRFPAGTRLAVLSVKSSGPELAAYVARKLNAALVNGRWFTVVERNEEALAGIDREMAIQFSGNVADAAVLSVGKQLGAEALVSGAFTRAGTGYRLEISALLVESARIGGQFSAEQIAADPLWASLDLSAPPDKSFSPGPFGGVWNGVAAYTIRGQSYRDTYSVSIYADGSCWVTVKSREGQTQAALGYWSAENSIFRLDCEFEHPAIAPGLLSSI